MRLLWNGGQSSRTEHGGRRLPAGFLPMPFLMGWILLLEEALTNSGTLTFHPIVPDGE